ncbi:MAG: hypothetical protein RLO08_00350 [Parvibaculaceae bacterium]
MPVVTKNDGTTINTGRSTPGVRMWCCIWKEFRARGDGKARRVETFGFAGSLGDVWQLRAALMAMDVLSVHAGTIKGAGRTRVARACLLTRERMRRDPEFRKELLMSLADAGYMGPVT